LKHEISFRDVYARIHKNKDGEYVSHRLKYDVWTHQQSSIK